MQAGQSGQPSPEPVSRTAAPVTTISATMTREATAEASEPGGRDGGQAGRPGRCGGSGWVRTRRQSYRRPGPGPAVGRRRPSGPATAWTVGSGRWSPGPGPPRRPVRCGPGSARYVALTKPRIIELLLVTTLPTMVVAQRGLPRSA